MANQLYALAKEALLGSLDLGSANIKAVLVDTGAYTPNFTTNQFLSDIPGGARIATSGNLGSKTISLGVFDAADLSLGAIDNNPTCEAIVLYEDTGVAGTSRLILYVDTAGGLPTPADFNGASVTIVWDNGANKIFALT